MKLPLFFLAGLAAFGCNHTKPQVHCTTNAQCTTPTQPGICVPTENVCAVMDPACPSGYRYDPTAGKSGCVPLVDMGPSASEDMSIITPADMTMILPADMTSTDLAVAPGSLVWKQQDSPVSQNLWGVAGSSVADVYAVGEGGTILHTVDSGTTWVTQTSGTSQTLYSVWASSNTDVWAVGAGPTILHSTGNGQWTPITNHGVTAGYVLIQVYGSGATDIYIAGGPQTILHTNDSGVSWTKWTTGTAGLPNCSFYSIWMSGPSDIFASGDNNCVVHGNGSAWGAPSQVNSPAKFYQRLWGTSPTNVYAAASPDTIRHSTGDGNWSDETVDLVTGTNVGYWGLWGSGPKDIYAVGTAGQVRHSVGTGTWLAQPSTVSNDLKSVWGSSKFDVFAVGNTGTIIHLETM